MAKTKKIKVTVDMINAAVKKLKRGKGGKFVKAKVPRQKYDWPVIKREFFESDIAEVKTYFERFYNAYNRHIQLSTAGWRDEKIAWRTEQNERALEEYNKNKIARAAKMLDQVDLLTEREIKRAHTDGFIDKQDLKILSDLVRTNNGLPTKIIHSKNENLHFDAGKIKKGLLDKLKEKFNGRSEKPITATGSDANVSRPEDTR